MKNPYQTLSAFTLWTWTSEKYASQYVTYEKDKIGEEASFRDFLESRDLLDDFFSYVGRTI